jgi:DNA-binding NarL/FixJ family response regulator
MGDGMNDSSDATNAGAPEGRARARVFLVEDHPVLAQGLVMLLQEAGFDVVGIAPEPHRALTALQSMAADLVVVGLSLEEGPVHDLVVALHHTRPTMGIAVYTTHDDPGSIRRALEAGALGFVTQREEPRVLVCCLEAVRAGRRFLSPVIFRALDRSPGARMAPYGTRLSAHEQEVFELIGQGYASPEIAERMGIARGTLETYYDRIIHKLRFDGRRGLRRHAIQFRTEKHEEVA